MDPSCSTCVNYVEQTAGEGECHWHPPIILVVAGEPVSIWPAVQSTDGCGVHAATFNARFLEIPETP